MKRMKLKRSKVNMNPRLIRKNKKKRKLQKLPKLNKSNKNSRMALKMRQQSKKIKI